MNLLISICIPTYKHPLYLTRLLHSIEIQSFKDFEVIVTDDSPNDEIEIVCKNFKEKLPLSYYKNLVALGTPANWNYAISKAKGEWIKIMHHDDWFSNKDSLQRFYDASIKGCDFIFSAYTDIDEEKNTTIVQTMTASQEKFLRQSPYNLFKQNFIGPPSTTLIKNNFSEWYDANIKWVVDFEFYIRYLNREKSFLFIKESLVNVGLSEHQVTKTAFRKREVEIPENIYLLNKIGHSHLKNIFVYDYYWRQLRNLSIRKMQDLTAFVDEKKIPKAIIDMLGFQSKFPLWLLRIGVVSKSLMFISYKRNRY